MTKTQLTDRCFTLGGFTVNPLEHTLCPTQPTDEQQTHQLPTKCIEVLCYLVERHPEIISRQELIDTIWQGNVSVGQKSLTNAIWSLRKVLNQNPEQIQAITTIRKSGYKLQLTPHFIENKAVEETKEAPLNEQVTEESPTKPASFKKSTLIIACISLVCLGLVGLFSPLFTFTPEHQQRPKILTPATTITSHPGRELYPTTSKDGRWLAYVWFRVDLTSELHIIDLMAKERQVNVIDVSPYRDLKPIWHPDNQTLFMIRKDNTNKRCHIVKIDKQNQTSEPFVPCSFKSHVFLTIDSKGEYLYYTGEDQQTEIPGRYRISLLSKANSKPERVSCLHECDYQDRDLEFSPNGLYSAQVRKYTPDTEDLYIVNETTQEVKRLTHDYQQLRGIQWHRDNRHLIVSAQIHGQRQGFILDSQIGDSKNIQIEGFSYPNINHHTNTIFYHEWRQKKFISTVKLAENQQGIYPLLQANHNFYHPHYSEKLNKIAFISTESGYSEIWMADADGNNRVQLTHNKQIVKFPRFSFDGQHIAFLAPQIGNDQNVIKVLALENKQIRTVRSPFRIHRRPTWHINNKHLITSIEDDHIHSLQLFDIHSKDKPKQIQADTLYAQMSPNGDIIYTKHNQGIWLKSGKQDTQLLTPETVGSMFNWSHHQGQLYFEKTSKKTQNISKLNIQTGEITDITNLAKRTLDIYGTTTYVAPRQELLLSKQQFPQVDVKEVGMGYE